MYYSSKMKINPYDKYWLQALLQNVKPNKVVKPKDTNKLECSCIEI